jgi:molecular chaperone DnaK (HSP70)
VTVPGYFRDNQRRTILDTGKKANLNIVQLLPVCLAASIPYDLDNSVKEKNILVFDFGGSTLEVSVFCSDNGVLEFLGTSSDLHLGGHDFDLRLVDYL